MYNVRVVTPGYLSIYLKAIFQRKAVDFGVSCIGKKKKKQNPVRFGPRAFPLFLLLTLKRKSFSMTIYYGVRVEMASVPACRVSQKQSVGSPGTGWRREKRLL